MADDHLKPQFVRRDVLVLKPPQVCTILGDEFLAEFHLLKAWESSLPLHQFLTTKAQSIQALLTSGGTPVTAEILHLLPALKVIVTTSAGLNDLDLPECWRRGISVANAGNVYSEDVADLAVGLLIDVVRKVSAANRFVKLGFWPVHGEYPLGSKLKSKRVGIIGLGRIGMEVAKRLEAFGCKILYNSRRMKPNLHYPFYSNVIELAANSDFIVICCGLTEKTQHMINKEVMLALGKKGVIVNIGRGDIIDEKELVHCLVQGELGGAGLDVFENEDDVPKELFVLDNVVLSPHTAVRTPESYSALCKLVTGNLDAFFSNKPLLSPVVTEESIS